MGHAMARMRAKLPHRAPRPADRRGALAGERSRGVEALPGYVWLDMQGKVQDVGEDELEFTF